MDYQSSMMVCCRLRLLRDEQTVGSGSKVGDGLNTPYQKRYCSQLGEDIQTPTQEGNYNDRIPISNHLLSITFLSIIFYRLISNMYFNSLYPSPVCSSQKIVKFYDDIK